MRRAVHFFACLACATLTNVFANTSCEVSFLADSIPNQLGEVVMETAEARSGPFNLPMNNLSRSLKAPARAFSLWSVDLNRSLAEVVLPEDESAFIILLLASSEVAELGYTPVVISANTPSFKGGDVYFYNNTNKAIVGHMGESKFTLNPGEGSIKTPQGFGDLKYYNVTFKAQEQGELQRIKSTKWPFSKTVRHYVFFSVDPVKDRVSLRAVDEFIVMPPD